MRFLCNMGLHKWKPVENPIYLINDVEAVKIRCDRCSKESYKPTGNKKPSSPKSSAHWAKEQVDKGSKIASIIEGTNQFQIHCPDCEYGELGAYNEPVIAAEFVWFWKKLKCNKCKCEFIGPV